jgi:ATP-binding cassette subfamily B protein
MAATMLFWAVHSWSIRQITAGDVVVITTLTFRILHGSRDVTLAFVEGIQQFAYIEETLRVIGQVHTIRDSPRAAPVDPGPGMIEFRNVSFGYDPQRPVLRDINLVIRAGEKVGIVGPSGAGKSTIAHLLQRLYDVGHGNILIDGQRIDAVTQESLSTILAVVPQEITLLHRSVLENIRFGDARASDEEVHSAARAAHCDAFVRRLPEGYHTVVGERGTKLSGGQRQRIGIARALLKHAPILILDEATSALDTESELQIQRNILGLLRDRTVIAVAHRLSTLTSFDRILVVHEGRIVEQGAAAELHRHGPLFRKMWRMQAEGLGSADVA